MDGEAVEGDVEEDAVGIIRTFTSFNFTFKLYIYCIYNIYCIYPT